MLQLHILCCDLMVQRASAYILIPVESLIPGVFTPLESLQERGINGGVLIPIVSTPVVLVCLLA